MIKMRLTPPTVLTQSYTPADINDIAHIRESAVPSSEINILRFGKAQPDDLFPWLRKGVESELAQALSGRSISYAEKSDPSIRHEEYLIVRDLDLQPTRAPSPTGQHGGRIVAQAEWRYNAPSDSSCKNSLVPEEPPGTAHPPPAFVNVALHDHFNALVEATLAERISGRPCYELREICTAISHLRRGIAKQLVTWVYPFADRDQLPIILAASPPGHGLYLACGFEDLIGTDGEVVVVEVNMSEWGGEGIHHHVLMVRWPTGWTGSRLWEDYRRRGP